MLFPGGASPPHPTDVLREVAALQMVLEAAERSCGLGGADSTAGRSLPRRAARLAWIRRCERLPPAMGCGAGRQVNGRSSRPNGASGEEDALSASSVVPLSKDIFLSSYAQRVRMRPGGSRQCPSDPVHPRRETDRPAPPGTRPGLGPWPCHPSRARSPHAPGGGQELRKSLSEPPLQPGWGGEGLGKPI